MEGSSGGNNCTTESFVLYTDYRLGRETQCEFGTFIHDNVIIKNVFNFQILDF